jgi:hypothetical protein
VNKICDGLYVKAVKISTEKFNWNDKAYVWFGIFVKEAENVLNKVQDTLNSKETKVLYRKLQDIAEDEFGNLNLRIETKNGDLKTR